MCTFPLPPSPPNARAFEWCKTVLAALMGALTITHGVEILRDRAFAATGRMLNSRNPGIVQW